MTRAYIGALKLSAICVLAAGADEPVLIRYGQSSDLVADRASASLGRPVEVSFVRWCARRNIARMIVENCNDQLPGTDAGWLRVSALVALKAIEIVAADNGIALQTDAQLRERAEAAVRAVELELRAMKASGSLRDVTRQYRELRLAREACGRRAQPWGAWFANYKIGLVRAAAVAQLTDRNLSLAAPVAAPREKFDLSSVVINSPSS